MDLLVESYIGFDPDMMSCDQKHHVLLQRRHYLQDLVGFQQSVRTLRDHTLLDHRQGHCHVHGGKMYCQMHQLLEMKHDHMDRQGT